MSDKPVEVMLKSWQIGLRILHRGHFDCSKVYTRNNLWLGVPTIILSSAVGTSILGELANANDLHLRVFIGLVSILAAVLASLQTFLNFSGRAEQHKAAAVKYGTLRREIEECLANCSANCPCPNDFCTQIRKRWDAVDMQSPTIPDAMFVKAEKIIKNIPR